MQRRQPSPEGRTVPRCFWCRSFEHCVWFVYLVVFEESDMAKWLAKVTELSQLVAESALPVRVSAAIPTSYWRGLSSEVLFLRNPEISQDLMIEAMDPVERCDSILIWLGRAQRSKPASQLFTRCPGNTTGWAQPRLPKARENLSCFGRSFQSS